MSAQRSRRQGAPRKRVLLIDDDCDHADSLVALLQLEGYAVECAPDGAHGLKRLREALPDLILLDFTLPDTSGADVGRTIRTWPASAHIPIIMESGMPEWVVRRYFDGFDAFLTKPIDPGSMIARVAELIGKA